MMILAVSRTMSLLVTLPPVIVLSAVTVVSVRSFLAMLPPPCLLPEQPKQYLPLWQSRESLLRGHSLAKCPGLLQWKHPSLCLSCRLNGLLRYTRMRLPKSSNWSSSLMAVDAASALSNSRKAKEQIPFLFFLTLSLPTPPNRSNNRRSSPYTTSSACVPSMLVMNTFRASQTVPLSREGDLDMVLNYRE